MALTGKQMQSLVPGERVVFAAGDDQHKMHGSVLTPYGERWGANHFAVQIAWDAGETTWIASLDGDLLSKEGKS